MESQVRLLNSSSPDEEELLDKAYYYDIEVSSSPHRRRGGGISSCCRRRDSPRIGLSMAITVFLVFLLLVIIGIVFSQPTNQSTLPLLNQSKSSQRLNNITLDDVLTGKYYPKPYNGTWISDTEIRYFSQNGDLIIYDVTSKSKTLVISANDISIYMEGKPPIKCSFSMDRDFVLLSYDAQKIFRHSSYSKYVIYNVKTREFTPLVPSSLAKKQRALQLAEWSPTRNALVFVYANNIYYKSSPYDTNSLQLTTDGNALVYNGVTDWVYEEEVFNSDMALWFSPDGNHLSFITFNDTQVDEIHFEIYGEPGSIGFQYPIIESIPYPKAGRTNPTAQVSLVTLLGVVGNSSTAKFVLRSDLQFPDVPPEHYVVGLVWATNIEMIVITLNRHQNDSRHHLCTVTGRCQTLLVDQQRNGWIDVEVPKVSEDGNSFVTITSQYEVITGKTHRHILKYTRDSRNFRLTHGKFSVDSITKWDHQNRRIYFSAPFYDWASDKAIPSTTHHYYIPEDGMGSHGPICITCQTVNTHNESCDSNTIELSKSSSYVVVTCNGPGVPEVFIKEVNVSAESTVWSTNVELRQAIDEVGLPIVRDFDIPIPNETDMFLKARIQIPPNYDPSKKYPLLLDVYGGPTSQKITDAFSIDWSDSLITSKEVIYASIDGRGSGRQSDDLKFQIYRKLGTLEVQDQIDGVTWLIENVPLIDGNRTAIWGWSYGGFATAMAIGRDTKNVFKCGIAVAPVTNWAFYDTIYTERYMGLPITTDNFKAYNSSDITNYVESFRGKNFFLIHGTADDNVHYQQSMILSRAFEKADILFRQLSYPDENHGLGSVRKHLYHSIEHFLFTECF